MLCFGAQRGHRYQANEDETAKGFQAFVQLLRQHSYVSRNRAEMAAGQAIDLSMGRRFQPLGRGKRGCRVGGKRRVERPGGQ